MKEEPQENVDIENVADGQLCIEMVPHDVDLDLRPFLHICLTLPLRSKPQVCIHRTFSFDDCMAYIHALVFDVFMVLNSL